MTLHLFLFLCVACIGFNEGHDITVSHAGHLFAEVIDANVLTPQCALKCIRFDEQHLGYHLDVQKEMSGIDRGVLEHKNSSAA